MTTVQAAASRIICPHQDCGRDNDAGRQACSACGGALEAFTSLYLLPAWFYNQGLLAYHAGNSQKAALCLRLSAELASSDPAPRVLLGKLHAQRGDLDAAITCWLEALEAAPRHETALTCLFEAKQILDSRKKGMKGQKGQKRRAIRRK